LWERFVWKYLKATADVIIEEGAAADLHIDGQWERDLDYFKAFPKGKCVFESDGVTDIYKIKEALGDRMPIKGDVSAVLTSLGTPDEVYNYCTRIIRDIGPGLILSSGCSLPPNAKVENVKAMIAAATGR
jgi:uroporphyrinogen-III decarboxylase